MQTDKLSGVLNIYGAREPHIQEPRFFKLVQRVSHINGATRDTKINRFLKRLLLSKEKVTPSPLAWNVLK